MSRRTYTPRPYYRMAVDFMHEHPRCALWAGMGTGKTSIVYGLLEEMALCGQFNDPVLVLGPLRVGRDTWPDEARKWEHLSGMKVSWIGGEHPERHAAIARKADVYTTNYEQLPWLVKHYGDNWPWKLVIADESTRLKSFRLKGGGRRAGELGKMAWERATRWVNLTGTPNPNGLLDLWGQTWFLDRGKRLGLSYDAFVRRWFYREPDGKGYQSQLMPFKHSFDEITGSLKDICLTIEAKDYFDLKDPIVTKIEVPLPEAARKIYDEFEDEMYAELLDNLAVEAFNAAALTNKCRQLANGAIYGATDRETQQKDNAPWRPIHDAKLDALDSVVEEAGGMPVLVAYSFRSDRERILARFKANNVALLDTKQGMADFKAGHKRIGLAHPKSMGHGIDGLQDVTNILVRFGHDWNLEERLQMLERIGPTRQMQSGLDRPVYVYDLVAQDTIEEVVLQRHQSKANVMQLLLNAMKRGERMVAA